MATIVRKDVPGAATDVAIVTGFSAEWLSLREPADTRARDPNLSTQLARWARRHSPARFIDLACGTGANLRYLASCVGGDQEWLLVDSDVALLEDAARLERLRAIPDCRVRTQRLDLATELRALDLAPDVIVTASALLDLVSERWLTQLIERCSANRCGALLALSYDGRITLTPSDRDDEWIRDLVNLHQRGDKGFGAALGPRACQRTRELFLEADYQVFAARSDWSLQPEERLLQQSLLEGWSSAATELATNERDRCRQWLARRLAHLATGASRIVVGHEDVLALPRD